MKRRWCSILAALALCLTLLPATALAEEGDPAPRAEQTWDCGDSGSNVTATLSEDGTLTITGSGAMANYNSASSVPWKDSKSSIRNVVIDEGVTSIGANAFLWCTSIKTVSIASTVGSIGQYAFNYCRELTEVVIPEGVTAIDRFTFSDCSKLSKVTIPSTVKTIGNNAFSGCKELRSVELPAGLTTLETGAFYSSGLTEVTIPDGVTHIGMTAFFNCASLTKVEIPSSVETIERNALGGSTNAKIYFAGTPEQWGNLTNGVDIGASTDNVVINPHTVTIENGGTGCSENGLYSEGTEVSVSAGTMAGKVFDGWTVDPDVTLGEGFNAAQAQTSFTMPGQDVTLTANWAEAVADANGTPFADLQKAFDAVASEGGGTVKLLKDVTVTELIRLT